MTKYLLCLLATVCLAPPIAAGAVSNAVNSVLGRALPDAGNRSKYNFNSDWKLLVGDPANAEKSAFNDATWKNITTPHAWNEDDAFRVDIKNLSTGIAWYRKHFHVPASTAGKKMFLEFEGIRHGGEFYLNDQHIGRSDNGVMAFGFDITSFVKQGQENVIAARIDNSWSYKEVSTGQTYQWASNSFYANYGGINKNVLLHVADNLYQTLPLYSNLGTVGPYIFAQNFDIAGKSASIVVDTQVRNEYSTAQTFTYDVVIQDASGTTVAKFAGDSYTLAPNATKVIGATASVSGLNFWSWGYGYLYDVSTSLSINGKVVDTVTTRTGFRKTSFTNGTFRLNDHVVHLKGYGQRSTNEWVALGSAVPAWLSDFSNKLITGSNGNFIRWMHVTPWKQDIESCDRIGLIMSMPAGDSEGDVTGRRWDQRLELMRDATIYNRNNPSIMFYESGNHGITEAHMTAMKNIRDTYDPSGGRAAGSREMLNSSVAEYGGEMLYINKSKRKPLWQMEYSRDEDLRKYWDVYSPPYHVDGSGAGEGAAYNRNQDSNAVEDVVRWFDYYEQRPGTGDRVNAGGANIIFSDTNTHHRGAENYRRSGEVDAVRLPKDGWYAHQVMWNTWVDADVPATRLIGHWNYASGVVKNVYVVSTSPKVELFINGKSQGFGQQSHNFLFTFSNVSYASGTLLAQSYAANGQVVSSDTRITSGQAAAIRLTPRVSPTGNFLANGADIALVDVEVVDSAGNRCPIALNLIAFTLSGEAEWRGGIAQGTGNYILSKTLPVENGVNRVLLRSTTNAGTVTLTATSSGLTSTQITLQTQEFPVTNGLSTQSPAAGLLSDLSRGPTPSGSGLVIKRTTLNPKSVSAGSGSGSTALSYDDDETTSWASSSTTSDAWIKYTLAAKSSINQVVMKLGDFKTKQYSLKISVDSTVVWTGQTPLSLGYVTLSFTATAGSAVTIASTSGKLEIIEGEIYGPV